MAQVKVRPLYPVREFCSDFGISRSTAKREIKAGRLRAFHIGRLTMIAGEDGLEWRDLYRDASLDAGDSSRRAA